jgi:hypothetical protein
MHLQGEGLSRTRQMMAGVRCSEGVASRCYYLDQTIANRCVCVAYRLPSGLGSPSEFAIAPAHTAATPAAILPAAPSGTSTRPLPQARPSLTTSVTSSAAVGSKGPHQHSSAPAYGAAPANQGRLFTSSEPNEPRDSGRSQYRSGAEVDDAGMRVFEWTGALKPHEQPMRDRVHQ